MDYLSEIPRDTLYVVFSYLNFEEIKYLTEYLQIYINHGRILSLKFTETYQELYPYISKDLYFFHKLFDLVEYQDDPKNTIERFYNQEPQAHMYEPLNIISLIYLKKEYSTLVGYFTQFPIFPLRYFEIAEAMMEFERSNQIEFYRGLSQLLFEDRLDLIQDEDFMDTIHVDMYNEINGYRFVLAYLLRLKYGDVYYIRHDIDEEIKNLLRNMDIDNITMYTQYKFILLSELSN